MTIPTSLFHLADSVAEVLVRARTSDLKWQLSALDKACEEAKRAWSGSNLGYHADVYADGLQPGAQFYPEWGLMDRWPTHQPDPRWQVMDPRVVSDHLLEEAGIGDLDAIKDRLNTIREELTTLKEQGISLLTVASNAVNDPFIERKLREVDEIVIADPATIAADLARDGPNWSRESEVISQGRRSRHTNV